MTKVVHLITTLRTAGGEMMLRKLLTHMDQERFRNTVISLEGLDYLGREIQRQGIPVFSLEMGRGTSPVRALLRLVRLLRAERPQVLQTWLYHADLLGLVAGTLAGVPAIAWNIRCGELRRQDHPRLLWWTRQLLAKLSSWPAAVVINSEAGRGVNERLGYRPKRWAVIPNGFELEVFRPSPSARVELRCELGLPLHTVLVGLVARFDPRKDHRTFLTAAGLLRAVNPDLHFVLVGPGVDKANEWLLGEVARLKLEDCVHLLGERRDMPRITAGLDVATCCSYSEGFPNVIGEAMACGVPCVATDVGDCAQLVGDAGVLVPPRDPTRLAEAWRHVLILEATERTALGLRGRERIRQLFDITHVAEQYEQLYDELAGKDA